MADFDNRLMRGATTVADAMDTGLRAHMLRVYNYMVGALGLTDASSITGPPVFCGPGAQALALRLPLMNTVPP